MVPGLCPQAELKEKLQSMYDVKDTQNVFLFGFRTQVGAAVLAQPVSREAMPGVGVRGRLHRVDARSCC